MPVTVMSMAVTLAFSSCLRRPAVRAVHPLVVQSADVRSRTVSTPVVSGRRVPCGDPVQTCPPWRVGSVLMSSVAVVDGGPVLPLAAAIRRAAEGAPASGGITRRSQRPAV